jgi:exodeoxyribonuclease V alpha subunit
MATEMTLFPEEKAQPEVTGKVSAIFFQNPDNFYKVLLVQVEQVNFDWTEKEVVVTGSFGDIKEEESYRFVGKLVTHPKYGMQFQASNYEKDQPTTKEGLIAYLAGDQFPGIGTKTAEKIVSALGLDAIQKILADPEVLKSLGIKTERIQTLVEQLTKNNGMDQIIIGLNSYGFGSQLAYTIYEKYHEETLQVLAERPYQLVKDIPGIGFKKADQIAAQQHIAADAPERIQAAILQEITELTQAEGDTYTQAKPLLNATLNLLRESRQQALAPDAVADQMIQLADQGDIISEDNRIYLRQLYRSEWKIAENLQRLMKMVKLPDYDEAQLDREIRRIEKLFKMNYGASQIATIKAALTSPVFLLTGGPGTGKTTIINAIVLLFAKLNDLSLELTDYKEKPFPILLAAPTGRAAKRMSEVTGLPASTIHRLLGLNGRENGDVVTKDLEGALLIIDEMSMVDTSLFRLLMQAVSNNMQVILVGDRDQLPSVGPGQVFSDLLMSHILPSSELTEIYRQDDGSSIIPLAHAIKDGRLPADFTKNQKDRSFIPCNAYQVEQAIDQIVTRAKAKGFTSQDIQVLAPMYRGAAGITKLNLEVQQILNPKTGPRQKEITFRQQTFRVGDKVLHLVNSPELNVFNGDIGEIVGVELAKDKGNEDKTDKLTIRFDATEVTYGRNDWSKLTLAFCTSIHKAQGSEFKMVILPIVHQYQRMLQRNLLYTAITRAQSLLILIGEQDAFATAVAHESINRKTTLQQRLQAVFNGEQPVKTPAVKPVAQPEAEASSTATAAPAEPTSTILTTAMVEQRQVHPMIGMKDLTPQDFKTA